MNEMLKKGLFRGLPVVNEILLAILLFAELAERVKDWKKQKKTEESSVVTVGSEEDPHDDDE